MSSIIIVDDRDDVRKTLQRRISLELKKINSEMAVIDIAPFDNFEEYNSFILENEGSLLILDERMHENSTNGIAVTYNGSELVEYLRVFFKELPIYSITSYHMDLDLQSRFKDFEEIISREGFYGDASSYVLRFSRSANRYFVDNQKKIEKIAIISQSIANNTADDNDILELRRVQEELNIPLSNYSFLDNNEYLKKLSNEADKLSELNIRIQDFLDKQ